VDINQTGLPAYTGPVEVLVTLNNLIGTDAGPFTLSVDAPSGTPLFSQTFTGSGTATSAPILVAGLTSDEAIFTLAFTGGGQSVDATIELTAVSTPEPMSILVLGSGLLGVGLVRRWNRSPSA